MVWMRIDSSGDESSLSPFRGLRNSHPSSVSLRMPDSEKTWNPPESVKIGLSQPMKRCRPPKRFTTSVPGVSHR